MIVYAVVDDALSPDFPLGVELRLFVRREDAERFIEEVRGDDPELGSYLRIEERNLDAGQRSGKSLGLSYLVQQVETEHDGSARTQTKESRSVSLPCLWARF